MTLCAWNIWYQMVWPDGDHKYRQECTLGIVSEWWEDAKLLLMTCNNSECDWEFTMFVVTIMTSSGHAQVVEQGRLFSGICRMVLDMEETYFCKIHFNSGITYWAAELCACSSSGAWALTQGVVLWHTSDRRWGRQLHPLDMCVWLRQQHQVLGALSVAWLVECQTDRGGCHIVPLRQSSHGPGLGIWPFMQ